MHQLLRMSFFRPSITQTGCALALLVGVGNHSASAEGAWVWTTFDLPISDLTFPGVLSDGGRIAGSYTDQGFFHGFLHDGSTWTTLDYPGSQNTSITGVSGDRIIGNHWLGAGFGAFLYDGTNWTPLTYPGSCNTNACGISGETIVGTYSDSGPQYTRGFLFDGQSWRSLDFPGASATGAYGVSGDTVVGDYLVGDRRYGFVYREGAWTTVQYPGAFWTRPYGVSGDLVVGNFYDTGYDEHGFLYDGTTWVPLKFPGAVSTQAAGVFGDTVLGTYTSGGRGHGFILVLPEPSTLSLFVIAGLLSFPHAPRKPPATKPRPFWGVLRRQVPKRMGRPSVAD